MTCTHRLPAVFCIVWLTTATLLGQTAPAQAPPSAPQRQGQAFDEQFKNRIDEVRAAN